jgi:hypothetical protein
MSKEAAQRAMREARYNERIAASAKSGGQVARRPRAAAASTPPVAPGEPVAAASSDPGLCGHRSMNGRTCTREAGHQAKSHRYS